MKYISTLMGEIMEGNVVSDLQRSNFIRPATQTQCNHQTFPEGHLRQFDLDSFKTFYVIPDLIMQEIQRCPDQQLCLYAFKKPSKSSASNKVWAWVLTDNFHQPITHCIMPGFRNTDTEISLVLEWFNVFRLTKYVDGFMTRELTKYLTDLREKGNGIKPYNFTVQAIPTHFTPAKDFESVTFNTPAEAIDHARQAILDKPSLKGRIEVLGNITDDQWDSLPTDYRHIFFDHAPQAKAARRAA